MQATEVNEMTQAMQEAGDKSSIVNRCAKAGAKGKSKTHVNRAVLRACTKDTWKPMVYKTKGIFWDAANECQVEDYFHCLLPYELFDNMVGNGDVSQYCDLPPGPLADAKAEWMEREGVAGDGHDIAVTGC